MTLLLLLTNARQDADVVSVPGAAVASSAAPVPVVLVDAASALATAAGVNPSFITTAVVTACNAIAGSTAPVPSVNIQATVASAIASAATPGRVVQVDTIAAMATASGTPPVAIIHIQTVSGTAIASMAMPLVSVNEDQDPTSGAAIASAVAPIIIVTLTGTSAPATASASAPVQKVGPTITSVASAVAGASAPDLANSITGRLRAALAYLQAEQIVAEAELISAQAAGDQTALDVAANRHSVLSQAVAECKRAIVIDTQKYLVPVAASASASAKSPVVS